MKKRYILYAYYIYMHIKKYSKSLARERERERPMSAPRYDNVIVFPPRSEVETTTVESRLIVQQPQMSYI